MPGTLESGQLRVGARFAAEGVTESEMRPHPKLSFGNACTSRSFLLSLTSLHERPITGARTGCTACTRAWDIALCGLPTAGVAALLSLTPGRADTFVVSTNSPTGPGSLRQAILDANVLPGEDRIFFDLSPDNEAIWLPTALPRITDSLLIEGAPKVTILGSGHYRGFDINASAVTIRGMAIKNFTEGVRIAGGWSNRIEHCSITENTYLGIALNGGGNHQVISNWISGNRIGIHDGFGSHGTNYIRGNLIGKDASGTDILGNADYGIQGAGYSRLVIGGLEAGDANVISGNGSGIYLESLGPVPGLIQGNFIGTDRSGTLKLGNAWAGVALGAGHHVGGVEPGAGNIIAFNAASGVVANDPTWIQGNRIFNNGFLGIGSTEARTNDYPDLDTLQNYPLLSRVLTDAASTLIEGTLISTPLAPVRIEFFANDQCDASGFGEGQRFLGVLDTATDDIGNAAFTFTASEGLPIPGVVTATATSADRGSSEFSPCHPVSSPQSVDLSVWQTDYPDPARLGSNITYTIIVSNAGPHRANHVILYDLLPPGAPLVALQSSAGHCIVLEGAVVCLLGSVDSGASVAAWVTIQANTGGLYLNQASVFSAELDHAPGNNVSEESTHVGVTDLAVRIILNQSPIRAGQPFTFALHVTNAGPDIAQHAQVGLSHPHNLLPDNTLLVITNLEPGASRQMSVSAVPANAGSFYLTAWVDSAQPDPNPANNLAWLSIHAEPDIDALTLERESYALSEGGQVTLRVHRTGPMEGELAVFYATRDGTALASTDYTPAAGTLVFVPGQTHAEIAIAALPDETAECNEFFFVSLAVAEGAAFFVSDTNAIFSIAEKPPRLAGYSRPITVRARDARLLTGQASWQASLSAKGERIVFASLASNLVEPPSFPALASHIFFRDLEAGQTIQLTPNQSDSPIANYYHPSLSGDGKVVVFVRSVWNGLLYFDEVIVRSLDGNSNLVASTGLETEWFDSLMISSNGAAVVFRDSRNQLYVSSSATGGHELVTASHDGANGANGASTPYTITPDGRFVTFESEAANLVPNDLNQSWDIFLRDLVTRTTHLVSINTDGVASGACSGPVQVSDDGRFVVFTSSAPGLAPDVPHAGWNVYLRDMLSGITRLVSPSISDFSCYPSMSADGRFIAYQSQPLGGENTKVFLWEAETGIATFVSASCAGKASGYAPRISPDGRYVFFHSSDADLSDGALVPNDSNIFRWDRLTGDTILISANKQRTGGARGIENYFALSQDGNALAFISDGAELAFGDHKNSTDLFVWQSAALLRLHISLAEGIITISWPGDSPPAVLESKTSASNWTPVTERVRKEDGKYVYECPIQDAALRFFHLRVL